MIAFVVALVLSGLFAPASAGSWTQSEGTGDVTIEFGTARVSVSEGDRFTVDSRVVNGSASVTGPYFAHLNVASLTGDVYVDPEDWSANRTMEVAPLAPGASTTLRWDVQAVNAGSFDLYAVLLPVGPGAAGAGPLAVSPPVHVVVAGRRTLSTGGELPVSIAVPLLLAAAAVALRLRSRG